MPTSSSGCAAGAATRASARRQRGDWRGDGWRSSPGRCEARRASSIGPCVALAFPDRRRARRDAGGADWLSVGGRGFRLDPADPRSRATHGWRSPRSSGAAGGARILAAAPIDQAMVETLFAERIETGAQVAFDPATGGVRASHGRRLGAIRLSGGQDSRADPAAIEAALLEGVRAHGLALLPWNEAARSLRIRAGFARLTIASLADLSDAALLADLDEWLPPCSPVIAAWRCRPGSAGRDARSAVRLAGPPDGRTARAEPFRNARGKPPPDRL